MRRKKNLDQYGSLRGANNNDEDGKR